MKLSDPELSRLRQWSQFRKSWRRLRWFCLFIAMVEIIGAAWMLRKLAALRFWPTVFVADQLELVHPLYERRQIKTDRFLLSFKNGTQLVLRDVLLTPAPKP